MDKVKVTLKGVSKYDFENDKRERVNGTTVWIEELTPELKENAVGYIPRKIAFNGNLAMFDKLKGLQFPVSANAILVTEFGSKGVITKIADFEPLQPINK